jgi:hypothetical protein
MIKTLIEILDNAPEPVEINTSAMFEIAELVREETGRVIKYKNAIYHYENAAGYHCQRKLKKTYNLSIDNKLPCVYDLQQKDLENIAEHGHSFNEI